MDIHKGGRTDVRINREQERDQAQSKGSSVVSILAGVLASFCLLLHYSTATKKASVSPRSCSTAAADFNSFAPPAAAAPRSHYCCCIIHVFLSSAQLTESNPAAAPKKETCCTEDPLLAESVIAALEVNNLGWSLS
ncbi:uncharacterized protein J3R85_005357 [Psidium guajava]|nr:uncharacterized protein J3R85_005357 [Psidium guajava]